MNENNFQTLKIEWRKLAKALNKYNQAYAYGNSLIPDDSYDSIKARLQEIEVIIGPQKSSPLQKIGHEVDRKAIVHTVPMLSLDHGYGNEWIATICKRVSNNEWIAEHKIDGIAIELRYINGKLSQAITRGDGKYGYDVTMHVQDIVPIIDKENLQVRGELYMTWKNFYSIQNLFATPRNAVAAKIMSKTNQNHIKIDFMAHELVNSNYETYAQSIQYIKSLKLQTMPTYICKNYNDIQQFFTDVQNLRNDLEYPIDGIVIKINDLSKWKQLGAHLTAPRYAFAIKFMPQTQHTEIKDIIMQVGKFGTITPVAILKPIEIQGSTISKATIHNLEELYKKNYQPKDIVQIAKAGDIIPYIQQIVSKNSTETVNIIKQCPVCKSIIEKRNSTWKCMAGWNCEAQKLQRMSHFVSKKAFDIKGLGEKILQDFIKQNWIKFPVDILNLDLLNDKQLHLRNGWQRKSVEKLQKSIMHARKRPLHNVIYGLCIENIGYDASQILAKNFDSLQHFVNSFLSENYICDIAKIGPIMVESIKNFLIKDMWIEKLLKIL